MNAVTAMRFVRRRLILLVTPPRDDPEGHDRLALLKQPAAIDDSTPFVSALQLAAAALDKAARARASATGGGMSVPPPSVIAARVPRLAVPRSDPRQLRGVGGGSQYSQYRGVTVIHRMSKRTGSMRISYRVHIGNTPKYNLGTFTVEEHGSREAAEHAAARAYDKRARELYGEVGSCGELFSRSDFKMTWIAS
jgi:hypothetical protein